MLDSLLLGVSGGLLVSCLALVAFVLARLGQYTNPTELASKVRALELELTDLVDRLDQWQRRDVARAARLKKEEKRANGEMPEAPAGDPVSLKAQLRRLVAERMQRR